MRGYTIDPSAGLRFPGTYRGLIEKMPHLKELGITAVELMPIQEFNEHDLSRVDTRTSERLKNLWGYDPLSGDSSALGEHRNITRTTQCADDDHCSRQGPVDLENRWISPRFILLFYAFRTLLLSVPLHIWRDRVLKTLGAALSPGTRRSTDSSRLYA